MNNDDMLTCAKEFINQDGATQSRTPAKRI
jgi:hypothetical protein